MNYSVLITLVETYQNDIWCVRIMFGLTLKADAIEEPFLVP